MARIGIIITTQQPNKHYTGSTERFTPTLSIDWCIVDLVERVRFDLNTAGTLLIDVEGRKYKLRNVKKSQLVATLRSFLCLPDYRMDEAAVK